MKYITIATTIKEFVWLQIIIIELGNIFLLPCVLYYDNQSYIPLNENLKHHDCLKHIDFYFHFLHEKEKFKILKPKFTPTASVWVDIFTKSLFKVKLHVSLQHFNIIASFISKQGGMLS